MRASVYGLYSGSATNAFRAAIDGNSSNAMILAPKPSPSTVVILAESNCEAIGVEPEAIGVEPKLKKSSVRPQFFYINKESIANLEKMRAVEK